jgi:hypothetical protein
MCSHRAVLFNINVTIFFLRIVFSRIGRLKAGDITIAWFIALSSRARISLWGLALNPKVFLPYQESIRLSFLHFSIA